MGYSGFSCCDVEIVGGVGVGIGRVGVVAKVVAQ